ncbi:MULTISPECIES: molecular chaperone HtpG [Ehrlichia]|uniref:Chaperone protein HtpG n=1 Tax=Ehrlichia cf. muris str. EmCRT TaxID=1359167 RepID=A0A0F3NCT2_9RICK|nr:MULTISPECIES: molecular chaperone HtpG [Ehrlichia]KJV65845.1 histidine kinase-, DNA gyrase B-, and HSP90-like ATPase family protein [Ehrlichia cf. muris str. EmCRT]OUC04125.1 heat shock protein 90 [Ehrlichia sp. Wisconsin_h]
MQDVINSEKLKFDAEVGKVLKLVIHSLYTNKDIFLRELVSNASDACDKLRYESLSNQDLIDQDSDFKIVISVDQDKNRLYISDNGIGMNRQELIDNLGTIAHSGTQRFLEAINSEASSSQGVVELIGQFGVGFYSAFMVANEVIVESRKAGESIGYQWRSSGDGEFTIAQLEGDQVPRGTRITLVLKPEESEFVDKFRIEHIISTYSYHINYPVYFLNDKGEEEKLNSDAAIWTKSKDEISAEEHQNFFRTVAHVGGEPWMILHNKNEGVIEYTNLLYVPSIKPFDLFHPDRKCSVKLYVNKVFITEDNVQIIPQYLRFLKGIIDSSDLPLNISRETLQNNKIIEKIKQSIVKRVLSELKKKAENDINDYKKFWENFGSVLKEGLCESMNTEFREELISACRFYSTHSDDLLISLEDYIERMKTGQDNIYYLTGNDLDSIKKSPQLEGFISRGIEVILLVDPVDDFWTNVVTDYQKVPLKSVIRADEDLEKFANLDKNEEVKENEDKSADSKEKIDIFVKYAVQVLGKLVSGVRVSKKLTNSPVCLAVADGSMDIRMERFLREQKQLNYKSTKILEINPKHPIISKMIDEHANVGENATLDDMLHLLLNQACILEGEELEDVSGFAERMNNVLAKIY